MSMERRALCKRLFKASVVLSLIAFALATLLTWWGHLALPGLSMSLAEVSLAQGQRREAAGNLKEARVFYEQALAGKFHGAENQNHCEKRLGVVLIGLGEYEAAVEYLSRAQASPQRSLNGFGPLVEALKALERWDEARREAERWLAESEGDSANRANACDALGQIALHEGDLDGAAGHLNEALALDPNHAAGADLARVYAARGDVEKARDMMIDYLASASPDDDTAAHWALLDSWMP